MTRARHPRSPVVQVTRVDWDDFASRLWERRVVHFKAGALPGFTDAQAFAAATGAAVEQARLTYAEGARPPMMLTIERMQQNEVAEGAPRREDGSFAGYQARMKARLGGRRYALVISELHSFAFELWAQERLLLDELWARLGLPLSGAITTLFHGNYEHTPVGVHRDRFGTILFALSGRKRMRLWVQQPWTAPVSTVLDYQAHVASSFAVELAPGEALYWPSSYFHVGESVDSEPATSVNIGLPIAEHRTSYFVDDLTVGVIDERDLPVERRARTRLRSVTASPLVPVQRALERGVLSPRLPRPLLQAIASVRQLAEPRAAQRHIQRTWLARMTASGLEPPPAPAPVCALRDDEMVQLVPGASLRWAASLDDRGQPILLCAGNGHAVELATGRSTALDKMLQRLTSGAQLPVAALLRGFPRPAQRRAARKLLEQLVSFRALRVIDASSR